MGFQCVQKWINLNDLQRENTSPVIKSNLLWQQRLAHVSTVLLICFLLNYAAMKFAS